MQTLDQLVNALDRLRSENNSRAEAFELIQRAAEGIQGLGISYYTKLLFFLRPTSDAYILDQFTAKSAQILFEPPLIPLTSANYPSPDSTPEQYGSFCEGVEELSQRLQIKNGSWTPEKVEQAMFDRRGGDWRKYLRRLFPKRAGKAKTDRVPRPAAAKDPGISSRPHKLAHAIEQVHRRRLDGGEVNLPDLAGSVTSKVPIRLHCCTVEGVIWQYAVHQKSVHAEVFCPAKHIGRYYRLCDHLDVSDHCFEDGIISNGAKGRKTRSIKLTLQLPLLHQKLDINEFAAHAVDNMQILYTRIGEYI